MDVTDSSPIAAEKDMALVLACEERIVNCWPAVETLRIDGFVVRFAHGYSGRANSATPIVPGADLDEKGIAVVERLYAAAGLRSLFRITPLAAPNLAARLLARGYQLRDESCGFVAPLELPFEESAADLALTAAPDIDWIEGVSALQRSDKNNPAHLAAIVTRIRLPAAFAMLRVQSRPIGFGLCVIDRGMAEIGSIILAPEYRGKGHGRALVQGLLRFAGENGAHSAFLQVEAGNLPAIALYKSLGFKHVYGYRTLIRVE